MFDKVYTSQLGLEFHIGPYPCPTKNGRPTFTRSEYEWIKQQGLKPDEFAFLHKAKLEDYTYSMIPEKEVSQAALWAKEFGDKIIAKLKGINTIEPCSKESSVTLDT